MSRINSPMQAIRTKNWIPAQKHTGMTSLNFNAGMTLSPHQKKRASKKPTLSHSAFKSKNLLFSRLTFFVFRDHCFCYVLRTWQIVQEFH